MSTIDEMRNCFFCGQFPCPDHKPLVDKAKKYLDEHYYSKKLPKDETVQPKIKATHTCHDNPLVLDFTCEGCNTALQAGGFDDLLQGRRDLVQRSVVDKAKCNCSPWEGCHAVSCPNHGERCTCKDCSDLRKKCAIIKDRDSKL